MALGDLNTKLESKSINPITLENGYVLEIGIENYKKIKNDNSLDDIIKSITVKVNYTEREKQQSVEITTVVIKETAENAG